jgi:hypothetical protein
MALGAFCLGLTPQASAQTAPSPDQLIDQLAQVDCHGPGLFEFSPFSDFWAVIPERYPQIHLEGRPPDCIPEAMRALVRLGPQALPALVRHISDARPTGLKIGWKLDPNEFRTGGQVFTAEYDARAHAYREDSFPSPFLDPCAELGCGNDRGFYEPYTIKIGDVCFVLIGQIVNRYMVAARYQPTGWIQVNSPVETPAIAAKVRADWTGVDAEGLKAALLADLHTPLRPAPPGYKRRFNDGRTYEQDEALALTELYAGALRRLRFYYPDVYASLSGDDLAKRQAFEQREAHPDLGPSPSADEFIDELATLNCRIPGVSETALPDGFLVEHASMEAFSTVLFEGQGKFRSPVVCNNTAAGNLVRDGAASLPALLRHLDDKRPTKLVIGRDVRLEPNAASGQVFAEEYDARRHAWSSPACVADQDCGARRPFERPYTVKVGDVCFVLIGQIVNRQLSAVRYQPPGLVLVNSPIETPALAARARADWAGVDGEALKASLLADIHADTLPGAPDAGTEATALRVVQWGALRRLRYYFPDAYAALGGADLQKRAAFEQAEREHGQD